MASRLSACSQPIWRLSPSSSHSSAIAACPCSPAIRPCCGQACARSESTIRWMEWAGCCEARIAENGEVGAGFKPAFAQQTKVVVNGQIPIHHTRLRGCKLRLRANPLDGVGEHLAAQYDVGFRGIFGDVVAAAADAGDEQHGGR